MESRNSDRANLYASLSVEQGQEKPDYQWLLEPVSEASPAGENLEFDPEFYQLEVAATPTEEREYGDFVVAANDVDWRQVLLDSTRLLKRTRDLRLLVLWHQAAVSGHGIGGLAAGFHVIRVWLETLWPTLHPELEGTDSTARWLCIAATSLNDGLFGIWRRSNLIASRTLTMSVKDFSAAVNRNSPQGAPGVDQIQAFLRDQPEIAQATMNDVKSIRAQIQQIDEIASAFGTGEAALNFEPFVRVLGEIEYVFAPTLPQDAEAPTAASENDQPTSLEAAVSMAPQAPSHSGCHDRSDAVRMIDVICQYYARHEPSHPAPIFLRRAQRMMQMDFMEIMKELLPGSIEQLDAIAGTQRD